MTSASTRIDDLPDNIPSRIINEINDARSEYSDVSDDLEHTKGESDYDVIKAKENFINTKKINESNLVDFVSNNSKEGLLVFILSMLITNREILRFIAQTAPFNKLDPNTILFSSIISFITLVIFMLVKFVFI